MLKELINENRLKYCGVGNCSNIDSTLKIHLCKTEAECIAFREELFTKKIIEKNYFFLNQKISSILMPYFAKIEKIISKLFDLDISLNEKIDKIAAKPSEYIIKFDEILGSYGYKMPVSRLFKHEDASSNFVILLKIFQWVRNNSMHAGDENILDMMINMNKKSGKKIEHNITPEKVDIFYNSQRISSYISSKTKSEMLMWPICITWIGIVNVPERIIATLGEINAELFSFYMQFPIFKTKILFYEILGLKKDWVTKYLKKFLD